MGPWEQQGCPRWAPGPRPPGECCHLVASGRGGPGAQEGPEGASFLEGLRGGQRPSTPGGWHSPPASHQHAPARHVSCHSVTTAPSDVPGPALTCWIPCPVHPWALRGAQRAHQPSGNAPRRGGHHLPAPRQVEGAGHGGRGGEISGWERGQRTRRAQVALWQQAPIMPLGQHLWEGELSLPGLP